MIEILPNWHPIFVHFSIVGVYLVGVLQLCLALRLHVKYQPTFVTVQKWSIGFATLSIIATLTTGLLAYYSVNHDTPSHLAMTNHRNLALLTGSLFLLCVILYVLKKETTTRLAGIGFIVAMVLVTVTAYKGGELVYRYGIGVLSMPEVTGDGHNHDHADSQEHGTDSHDISTVDISAPEKVMHDTVQSSEKNFSAEDSISKKHSEHDNSDGHHKEQTLIMFSGQDTQVAQTITKFHDALQNGQAQIARSLLADNVLIFEGGGVERSAKQYASHHMVSDMAFLQTMEVKLLEQHIQVYGDTATAMSRSQFTGRYKDKDINVQSMETLILHKKQDEWKIVNIHWSNK